MAPVYRVPGPCTISWGVATPTSLGMTKEGIRIRPTTQWRPITDDEHGTEPADFIFTGKSCVVECILVNMTQVAAADPYIGKLLENVDGSGNSVVGMMTHSGDTSPSSGDDLSRELWIVERDGTTTWKAYHATPTEPSAIILSAVQEDQIPIAFLINPDVNNKLFYALPAYIT